jgi:hypothetical protein
MQLQQLWRELIEVEAQCQDQLAAAASRISSTRRSLNKAPQRSVRVSRVTNTVHRQLKTVFQASSLVIAHSAYS